MQNGNANYAVIFTYSFSADTAVYLFEDEETAKRFLKESYVEELRRAADILRAAEGTDAYFAVKSILAGIKPIRGTAAGTEYIDRSAAIEAVTEIVEKTMRVMKKDRFAAGVLMPAMALADLECIPLQSPCALCIHNPPSSTDGKPCCICPACGGKLERLPAADDLQVTCYEPEEEH